MCVFAYFQKILKIVHRYGKKNHRHYEMIIAASINPLQSKLFFTWLNLVDWNCWYICYIETLHKITFYLYQMNPLICCMYLKNTFNIFMLLYFAIHLEPVFVYFIYATWNVWVAQNSLTTIFYVCSTIKFSLEAKVVKLPSCFVYFAFVILLLAATTGVCMCVCLSVYVSAGRQNY